MLASILTYEQNMALLALIFGVAIYRASRLAINNPDKTLTFYKLVRAFLQK